MRRYHSSAGKAGANANGGEGWLSSLCEELLGSGLPSLTLLHLAPCRELMQGFQALANSLRERDTDLALESKRERKRARTGEAQDHGMASETLSAGHAFEGMADAEMHAPHEQDDLSNVPHTDMSDIEIERLRAAGSDPNTPLGGGSLLGLGPLGYRQKLAGLTSVGGRSRATTASSGSMSDASREMEMAPRDSVGGRLKAATASSWSMSDASREMEMARRDSVGGRSRASTDSSRSMSDAPRKMEMAPRDR
eukprot:gene13557-19428_t